MTRRTYWLTVSLGLAAGAAAIATSVQGCGDTGSFTCPVPAFDHKDFAGRPDPCCHASTCCLNPLLDHYAPDPAQHVDPDILWDPCCMTEPCPEHNVNLPPDAGAGSANCDGPCVPPAPRGWWGPALLWVGTPGEEPECPSYAAHEVYTGFADLIAEPFGCAKCACDAPTGECQLPTKLTANAKDCDSGPGIATPFDPPASWDGKCTQQNAVPAQAKCNGGLCVASLSIDPLKLVESGCVAHTVEPPPPHVSAFGPPWKTAALACQLNCTSGCESGEKVCVPEGNASPAPDFATCVYTQGEEECPAEYPERHVFYKDYTDTRACTACSCDPPVGGACTASLSVYQEGACQGAPFLHAYPITAKGSPFCVDLAPGLALGSKAMTAPTYIPGACTPHGGELTGAMVEEGPSTFCCVQS